ncbi:hypothetical protein B0H12DRAFT_1227993 [Mycena haematopus]|nr:hypothetical protein B0H12DRAFT_1227993 [Mycena haematopus]
MASPASPASDAASDASHCDELNVDDTAYRPFERPYQSRRRHDWDADVAEASAAPPPKKSTCKPKSAEDDEEDEVVEATSAPSAPSVGDARTLGQHTPVLSSSMAHRAPRHAAPVPGPSGAPGDAAPHNAAPCDAGAATFDIGLLAALSPEECAVVLRSLPAPTLVAGARHTLQPQP